MPFNYSDFKIISYGKILSTMDVALNHLEDSRKRPVLILAEEQLEGKGRHQSNWMSPKGGLYLTYIIHLEEELQPLQFPILHYAIALSVQQVIQDYFQIKALIKWPNDIVVDRRKLGGVLLEFLFKEHQYLLIGLGINVNLEIDSLSELMKDKVTSLESILSKKIDLKYFTELITNSVCGYLDKVLSNELDNIVEMSNKNLVNLNKKHTLGNKTYISRGINSEGLLILEKNKKQILINITDSKSVGIV